MRISSNARNIIIILLLALAVAVLPGGGTGARAAIQAISLLFLGSLGWFASIMYRQHRSELYGLGDHRRVALYVALGVAALTFTATSRLWATPTGELAWFVLIVGAAYTVFTVLWSSRRY